MQSALRNAVAHALPWNQLVHVLGIDSANLGHNHALFDCVISFQDWRTRAESPYSKMAAAGMRPQVLWSSTGAKFKLMIELMAVDDEALVVRLEYDDDCYPTPSHIDAIPHLFLRALEVLTTSASTASLTQLRREVLRAGKGHLQPSTSDAQIPGPLSTILPSSNVLSLVWVGASVT